MHNLPGNGCNLIMYSYPIQAKHAYEQFWQTSVTMPTGLSSGNNYYYKSMSLQ